MARLVGRTRRRSSGRPRRTSIPPVRSRSWRRSACLGEVEFQKSTLKGWMGADRGARAACARGRRAPRHRLPRPLRRGVDRRPLQRPAPFAAPPRDHSARGGHCCVLKLSSALRQRPRYCSIWCRSMSNDRCQRQSSNHGRYQKTLDAAVEELGPKAVAYRADVTDSNACADLLVKVLTAWISSPLTRYSVRGHPNRP